MQSSSSSLRVAICVSGELDLFAAPALREELMAHAEVAHGPELVLDLSGVEFMDSAGLKPFVEAQDLLNHRGRALRLCPVPRAVARLIRAAGHADTFNLLDVAPCEVVHVRTRGIPAAHGRPGPETHLTTA